MDIGTFIVLTTDRFEAPKPANVSVGAVGMVEDIEDLGSLFQVRFSGDRSIHLRENEFRLATPKEVADNDNDPDHDDMYATDEQTMVELSEALRLLGNPITLMKYISAAKMRAHGELDTNPEQVKLMVDRIRRDHRDNPPKAQPLNAASYAERHKRWTQVTTAAATSVEGMENRKTKPKYVIQKGGTEELYLSGDGTWGSYEAAKRFDDQDKAEQFAIDYKIGDDYGLFPCSVSRPY